MTYSVSINRQLRDTVSWLTSEHMIVQYIHSLRRAVVASSENRPPRTQDQVCPNSPDRPFLPISPKSYQIGFVRLDFDSQYQKKKLSTCQSSQCYGKS